MWPELVVSVARLVIATALLYFTWKRRDHPFIWAIGILAVFVLAGGVAYALEAFWALTGSTALVTVERHARFITAGMSFITAVLAWPVVRRIIHWQASEADRRQARAAIDFDERVFQTIFESAPIGIALVSQDGCIHRSNNQFQTMLGYTSDELKKLRVSDITHPDDVEPGATFFADTIAGRRTSYTVEKRYVGKDGRVLWALLVVSAVRNNEAIAFFLGMVVDMTDRKKSETQLKHSNAELERFAYIASHDLQAPLRAIIGSIELLQRHAGPNLDDKSQKYLRLTADGAKGMQQLVQDLLRYSRVGRGQIELSSVDLNEVMTEVLRTFETQTAALGAQILVPPLPAIHGNRTMLVQVFQNIIDNALKYHRDDVPPIITVTTRPVFGQWEICIRDNGIGINPSYLGRLFGVFQRLHGPKSKYEGTGIGLAVAKKVIERHGGHISARSEGEGKGATFCLTLPTHYVPVEDDADAPDG